MDHTTVSAVQLVGQFKDWPADAVYVGMPGNASRGFGIPDALAIHGKPWAFKDDPRGWEVPYIQYLVGRLASPAYYEAVKSLHGRTLLCWCVAKELQRGREVKCHARILAEFVELTFHARD